MIINPEDYPECFAKLAQRMLDARKHTLKLMNSHEKLICKYILNAFPELGRGPMFDEIVENTLLPEENVASGLERLNSIDMLKFDEETGQVLVLYPLSGISCPHEVHIKGKKPVYGM